MAENVKRQACVAFTILFIVLGIIGTFLYWVTPIVKIVPIDKARQSIEAQKRSKELEARLLKSSKKTAPPGAVSEPGKK